MVRWRKGQADGEKKKRREKEGKTNDSLLSGCSDEPSRALIFLLVWIDGEMKEGERWTASGTMGGGMQ